MILFFIFIFFREVGKSPKQPLKEKCPGMTLGLCQKLV